MGPTEARGAGGAGVHMGWKPAHWESGNFCLGFPKRTDDKGRCTCLPFEVTQVFLGHSSSRRGPARQSSKGLGGGGEARSKEGRIPGLGVAGSLEIWWVKGYSPLSSLCPGCMLFALSKEGSPAPGRSWKNLEEPCPPRGLARPSPTPEPFPGATQCRTLRGRGRRGAGGRSPEPRSEPGDICSVCQGPAGRWQRARPGGWRGRERGAPSLQGSAGPGAETGLSGRERGVRGEDAGRDTLTSAPPEPGSDK